MFTGAGWGGGDPAVRSRVGVNGASERSEKGAQQRGDTYKRTERVGRCTHLHCSAAYLNSAGSLLTEESGFTQGPGLQVPEGCWFFKQGKQFYIQFSHQSSAIMILLFRQKIPPKMFCLSDCCLGEFVTWLWLKFSNPTNFMQSLEILIQSKMKRFSVFACGLEDWITSLHDQASRPKTHMPQSGLTPFWTPPTSAIFIILCTVDLCHAKL